MIHPVSSAWNPKIFRQARVEPLSECAGNHGGAQIDHHPVILGSAL